MFDLLTNIPAIMGAIAAAIIALWGFGRSKKKQGRAELQDEMQDAYNATTKELNHDKATRPTDPVAVLDGLHGFAKRGKRSGDP